MIVINLEKSKELAHNLRRYCRNEEFAPLDEIISKQIPGTDVFVIEEKRQVLRDKYATMQEHINASISFNQLKVAIASIIPTDVSSQTTATPSSGDIPQSTL